MYCRQTTATFNTYIKLYLLELAKLSLFYLEPVQW